MSCGTINPVKDVKSALIKPATSPSAVPEPLATTLRLFDDAFRRKWREALAEFQEGHLDELGHKK